ncbi:hypothetical protein NC652_004915 [Populus alba x Populus x berolinensis]|nr:hypothetical protein NC652_004915 [Populus alba x Populus x berolinensis]
MNGLRRYEVAGKWRARMNDGWLPFMFNHRPNEVDMIRKLIKEYCDRYMVEAGSSMPTRLNIYANGTFRRVCDQSSKSNNCHIPTRADHGQTDFSKNKRRALGAHPNHPNHFLCGVEAA